MLLWLVDVVIIVIVVVVDEVVVVFICGAGLQRRPEDANVYALFFLYFFSLLSFVVLFITWSGGEGYQEDPGYLRVC